MLREVYRTRRRHVKLYTKGDQEHGDHRIRTTHLTRCPERLFRDDLQQPRSPQAHGHEELVERFDSDGDGRVDMEEWDHARREAEAIVEDHVAKAAMKPDVDVLMKSEEDHPFILSTKSQDELTQVYRWKATGGLILFVAGFVALGVTLTARFGPTP